MYDIRRSNLLSIESIKMYLYDIAILGNAGNKIIQEIKGLEYRKSTLCKKENLDLREYQREKLDGKKYYGIWVVLFIIEYIIFIMYAFSGGSVPSWIIENQGLSIVLVLAIMLFLPSIPFLYGARKVRERNEVIDLRREQIIQEHNKLEKERLERERDEIYKINEKIAQKKDEIKKLRTEIKNLYSLEILHKDYCDTRICGVLFQLFDAGRVSNLTEAMNLYEDLKWKSEMKSMMESLLEKVDEMIRVQRNIEYYSRCIVDNQSEMKKMLNDISMNQQNIVASQEAIEMNTDIIAYNTSTMRILTELCYIKNEL